MRQRHDSFIMTCMIMIVIFMAAHIATAQAYETEEVEVVEETTYTDSGSYRGGSTSTAVGNYAIKIGPVGAVYTVDSNTELDPGVGGFFAFDYRFHPNFSAEIGVMATLQDGTGISNGDNNIILLGVPTFDLKYYFLGESRWDPYALLGFGFYTLTEGSADNGSTAFGIGANLGLGFDYYITERFSLGFAAIFRSIALIESIDGPNNASAQFPFTMVGSFGYHF